MRTVALALGAAVALEWTGASYAGTGERRLAWFMQDLETRQWCAFVNEANARSAEEGERFDWHESGRLEYGDDARVTVMVMSQSEDAYVEDSYSFAPDLSVAQVVRKGHYVNDPFFTATYRPDDAGTLNLTAETVEASGHWPHTTYFLEWPLYRTFAELPFAPLIETAPQLSLSANC
jgi:hypothetical protein